MLYVQAGEDENVLPHVHLYSIEEKFDVRFTIDKEPRVLSVKSYGKRDASDKFHDILLLVRDWMQPNMYSAFAVSASNCMFALVIYNTLNPRKHHINVFQKC